jgi:hypothetical protein
MRPLAEILVVASDHLLRQYPKACEEYFQNSLLKGVAICGDDAVRDGIISAEEYSAVQQEDENRISLEADVRWLPARERLELWELKNKVESALAACGGMG